MAKGKRKSGGGGGSKAAKKKNRAKSRKHALRSATYAVKKLIDSAIAAGTPEGDAAAIARMRKKSVRRATAATARAETHVEVPRRRRRVDIPRRRRRARA
mmetsp:Transcript_22814/g.68410  ORF Transcript_22814/g.68410 Transcript_22814/m.68410 type:complete len:100 (-) Transcript_22814:100-399(-)